MVSCSQKYKSETLPQVKYTEIAESTIISIYLINDTSPLHSTKHKATCKATGLDMLEPKKQKFQLTVMFSSGILPNKLTALLKSIIFVKVKTIFSLSVTK